MTDVRTVTGDSKDSIAELSQLNLAETAVTAVTAVTTVKAVTTVQAVSAVHTFLADLWLMNCVQGYLPWINNIIADAKCN